MDRPRPRARLLLLAALLTSVLLGGPALATAIAAEPATTAMTPACASVNIRSGPSTSATIAVKLPLGAHLTVTATVAGGAWITACPTSKSGSTWYTVSAIDGRTVQDRFGVAALYAATGVLDPAPTVSEPSPAPTPEPQPVPEPDAATPGCPGVNIRTAASTSAGIAVKLSPGVVVGVDGTTNGGSWKATCPTSSAGSTWYRVVEIDGRPVAATYGREVLFAATGVLTPVTIGSTEGLTMLGAVTTFHGRGWGHGVGMSQYGARGRALAGQSAAEILAHYYPGTSLGDLDPETRIRVLVLDDRAATALKPLTVVGRQAEWRIAGIDVLFPADARLRLWPDATAAGAWRLVVDAADGTVLLDQPAPTDLTVVAATPMSILELTSKPSAYDEYRDRLRVLLSAATADVINELRVEYYLRGVVPVEMPSSWPRAAREAQAIAARSYAAHRLHPATGTFDAWDDTRSQVYRGYLAETLAGTEAVTSTAGRVLRYGGRIANAVFHSTGGGATEDNENVFNPASGAKGTPLAYLRGSADRDPNGVPYDAGAPYAAWRTNTYSVAALSAMFAADARTDVGTIVALDLRNRGVSGRLVSVTLVGTEGSRTVSGNVFIGVFNAHRPTGDPYLRTPLLDVAPIP